MTTLTTVGYTALNLERSGPVDGDPVVLLHGWGSSAHLMQPIARALNDTYRIYNLDLPGHGRSPEPPLPYGVPEFASLVQELLEDEISRPATLIGHSNGGRIALYMASTPPLSDLIRSLVLISPSGITPIRGWKYYLRKYSAQTLKAPFKLLPEPLSHHGQDWLRHSLLWRALGSSDYTALQGVMRDTFVKTVNCYLDDQVKRITVPTLLFWGNQDTAVSRHQMGVLESSIPDAGLVELDQAGHYGYLDAPDTFIAATRYFLEQAV